MKYEVQIAKSARKELDRIEKPNRKRIEDKIEALADDPRPAGVTALVGTEGMRIRIGNYRVVYLIDDSVRIVSVTKVGHRGSVYRGR